MAPKKKTQDLDREEKTNVGVLLPKSLWTRFRIYCIETEQKPGPLLTKLIEDYLQREDRQSK